MIRGRRWSLKEKVAFLRDPGTYSDRPRHVETVETHFAWVFLTTRYAYKLKKPVRQAAMDYRTLGARERGCRGELRLNRCLAPGVYRSVVPLITRGGALELGKGAVALGKGDRVEDWLVKMRRLPSDRMFDRALERGTVSGAELDRLIATLAGFFRRAKPMPMQGAGYVARLRRQVRGNRRALRRYGVRLQQPLVAELAAAQLEFIARARNLLAARGARVVEGHGDLRAEHVCLGPPVCVIDCLEFDRDLRLLDPAEEIAILALEVERLGRRRLAGELMRRFCATSNDPVVRAVLEFYMSHRAATRAMLAAWHLDDPQFPVARPWLLRTHSYLKSSLRHVRRALRFLETANLHGVGGRPLLKQRRERRSAQHARDRLPEQRSNRQYGQSAAP